MNESAAHITPWSTDTVPARQRLDYYQDMLTSAVTPMWMSNAAPDSFDSDVVMADVGPLAVHRMRGSPHTVHRGARELERSLRHTFHIVLERSSPALLEQRGRIRLSPGDAFFCDSYYALELAYPAGFADASHFARVLRRRSGCTPSQIRAEGSR